MTLEFANKEAKRRTDALGTTHYVLKSNAEMDEYLVTATAYKGYEVMATYSPVMTETEIVEAVAAMVPYEDVTEPSGICETHGTDLTTCPCSTLPPAPPVVANCPILVGHLNALTAKGGAYAVLALNLVAILDDVEGIAGLMDHEFPANRHAIARAEHISECSIRLLTVIREIA